MREMTIKFKGPSDWFKVVCIRSLDDPNKKTSIGRKELVVSLKGLPKFTEEHQGPPRRVTWNRGKTMSDQQLLERITSNQKVTVGKPVIKKRG